MLGLTASEAELLVNRAMARLGRGRYKLRALTFVLATAAPLRPAIPRRLRLRAIQPLLHALFPGTSENLLYVEPASRGRGMAGDD